MATSSPSTDSEGTLRLGVLGDTHLAAVPYPKAAWHNAYDFDGLPERVRAAVRRFEHARVDAVCLIGDLTHDGSVSALQPLVDALAQVDLPVLLVAGNHDPGYALLRSTIPRAQVVRPEGQKLAGWRIAGLQVTAGSWFAARAEALPQVHEWGQDRTVLLTHFPVFSYAQQFAERGLPYPGDLIGRRAIAAALARRAAPTIVISGHIHARASSHDGRVLQLVQGALVEPPYEFSLVEISRRAVTRQAFTLAGPPARMRPPALVGISERFVLGDDAWRPAGPTVDDRVSTLAPPASVAGCIHQTIR